jgi:hypothetical protein
MEMGGLFDKCLVGDADTVMMSAYMGEIDGGKGIFGPDFTRDIIKWQRVTSAYFNKSIGFVPGAVNHKWHGSRNDRNYLGRRSILNSDEFPYEPAKCLYYDDNGLLHFTESVRDHYNSKILRYFRSRNED